MQKNDTGTLVKTGEELFGDATLFKVASTYVAGTPEQLFGVYESVVIAQFLQQIL